MSKMVVHFLLIGIQESQSGLGRQATQCAHAFIAVCAIMIADDFHTAGEQNHQGV